MIFSFSLFYAHDALLSDCRLICGESIIRQVPPVVTVSLRIIRKTLSSIISFSVSLNITLTFIGGAVNAASHIRKITVLVFAIGSYLRVEIFIIFRCPIKGVKNMLVHCSRFATGSYPC